MKNPKSPIHGFAAFFNLALTLSFMVVVLLNAPEATLRGRKVIMAISAFMTLAHVEFIARTWSIDAVSKQARATTFVSALIWLIIALSLREL